ncbi:signal peptidase I [Janibacter sp. GS2]|uniref:signal peptidase I n=1 Tax=Janibacter sp. GS2 TaxID=3442646 RepID=UPI003EBDD519
MGWLLATLLLLLCVLLVVTVAYPKAKGYVPLTILSGSMEPTYPVGSQVFVEPVETPAEAATQVGVGSTITFMPRPDDPTLVTHRVVAVAYTADGAPRFTTQGDANNTPDEAKVGPTQLRGVVRYHVPWVGHVATSMTQNRKGSLATALAGALFLYATWNVLAAARQRRRRMQPGDEDAR